MWSKIKKSIQKLPFSLKYAFLPSLCFFIFLFITAISFGKIYSTFLANQILDSVNSGITSDSVHLLSEGNKVADIDLLKTYILSEDSYGILGVLAKEREQRDIGLMGATNKRGVIIARTKTVSARGDNVFISSPQGRALVKQSPVSSIEMSGFGAQLLMTTGRKVIHDGEMIGALFSNYLMDDAYAQKFSKKYLGETGAHVLFYTKEYGVYGSSFPDTDTNTLIKSYFNPESDWIKNKRSDDIISFGPNNYYLVKNIVFPGLEYSPGGALVFVPYHGVSAITYVLIALSTFIFFSVIAWVVHKKKVRECCGKKYYVFFACAVFLLFIFFLFAFNISFVKYLKLKHVPYSLYNSSIRLQPESGVFVKKFERTVSILVDTGDEHVNSVDVTLHYDPLLFAIEDVLVDDSFCTFFVEKSIDTKKGEVKIVCGLPTPGFSGKAGNVANLLLKPLKAGSGSLVFSEDTQVFANDGLGTDVLRFATDGSYVIEDDSSQGLSDSVHASSTQPLVVFSVTHSNSERWYSSRKIDFNWSAGNKESFIYSLDNSSSTVPSGKDRVDGNHISLVAPRDGIFYFHIASVLNKGGLGPVTHYKVKIDTDPPTNVSLKASETSVKVGDVVRLEFDADDNLSGLQRLNYVSFDDLLFLPVGRQTYVPLTDLGVKKVTFRIYDRAGNYSEQSIFIDVGPTSVK